MWLAAHGRCWTVDRLPKRGLPHPAQCPLCDQGEEDIQHLLVGCVFARQIWFHLLQLVGLAHLAPQPEGTSFDCRWEKIDQIGVGDLKKGINTLIILGSWSLWRHRNDCVFNNAAPSLAAVLIMIKDEAQLW